LDGATVILTAVGGRRSHYRQLVVQAEHEVLKIIASLVIASVRGAVR
jgi:hypothetical protein